MRKFNISLELGVSLIFSSIKIQSGFVELRETVCSCVYSTRVTFSRYGAYIDVSFLIQRRKSRRSNERFPASRPSGRGIFAPQRCFQSHFGECLFRIPFAFCARTCTVHELFAQNFFSISSFTQGSASLLYPSRFGRQKRYLQAYRKLFNYYKWGRRKFFLYPITVARLERAGESYARLTSSVPSYISR